MRDYDSLAHRHSSQDMCVEPPMSLIANLIGFVPAEEDLHYALGFYAGGSGIDDRLAVRCRIDLAHWPDVVGRLRLKSVHDVLCDAGWQEDFLWLIDAQDAEARSKPIVIASSMRRDRFFRTRSIIAGRSFSPTAAISTHGVRSGVARSI